MDKQKNKIADLNKSAIDRLNADKLTKYLQSAQNVSNNLTNWIPKIAEEVSKIIQQYYKSLSEKDIKELADKRFDTLKSLREFCYDKVDYDRTDKKNINHAFEMVVNRGCKAGKMIADKLADLQVKEGELLGTSNKVYPTIRVENKNKKIKITKVKMKPCFDIGISCLKKDINFFLKRKPKYKIDKFPLK